VVKGQPDRNEEHNVRDGDPGENGNPGDGQRGWQAEIVKLIKPFFDPPDIGISGKIH
jgi:hypothetical protein